MSTNRKRLLFNPAAIESSVRKRDNQQPYISTCGVSLLDTISLPPINNFITETFEEENRPYGVTYPFKSDTDDYLEIQISPQKDTLLDLFSCILTTTFQIVDNKDAEIKDSAAKPIIPINNFGLAAFRNIEVEIKLGP